MKARLTRREALAAALAVMTTGALGHRSVLQAATAGATPRFVAFSLRRAAEIVRNVSADKLLRALGGITRVAGVVHDRAGDVILVGLAEPTLPQAEFDYLVTALRARFEQDEFPLVSIDPVQDTPRTGEQSVRFLGPLADSPYGRDLLACDVLLKRYSLSLAKTVTAAPAYNLLLEQDIRRKLEKNGVKVLDVQWKGPEDGAQFTAQNHGARVETTASYQARFWFYARLPYRADCDPDMVHPEVFSIRRLPLCLLSEGVPGADGQSGQYAREEFSRRFTENLPILLEAYPILKRLKTIYDLTAAADAIRAIDRNVARLPYVHGILKDHQVTVTPTKRSHPLEEQFGFVRRDDRRKQVIRISGGIEFVRDEIADAVENLDYGVLTELRSLVLGSRPSENALSWRVPLEGWRMPNAADLHLPTSSDWSDVSWRAPAGRDAGCSLLSQSVTLAADAAGGGGRGAEFLGFAGLAAVPPLKGVSMRIDVTDESFHRSTDGSLKDLRDSLRGGRPSDGALMWSSEAPLDRPKGEP